ncbi:MAG: 1-acyl-sn-glycerol-3-phosphate acyltransferase, partial [Clostridia bacterium]|nr:1-acyl-sn-glycerol-3-phosphate acyltransferase [Clostridia bacterium]
MNNNTTKTHKAWGLDYLLFDFMKVTAALPGLLWFRPRWIYENDAAKKRIRGGALLVSNHDGFFDPLYLQFAVWYRRHHFICSKEFFEGRAAWMFRAFHCIPIDRENFQMSSFRGILDHLRAGELVTIFPEGHVNDGSGEIAAFKSGMVLMAMQSRTPIIPVYLKPRAHWYSRLVFAIGEEVDPNTLFADRPAMQRIDAIASMLHEREEQLKHLV